MASKAELLASARKKGQKQQIFRRGRGTTTSVRQPSADPSAGREAKAVSDFLGTMLKFSPGVLDAYNRETNEENKKLVAKGEATYKNATPAQRKQFRDNVRNGTISGGESPYFREGLKRSHADAMALEYGNSVMLAWESSEAKNSADPEAFNNFLDEFQHKAEGPPGQNRSWQERVGDLGDHVANEEFWPKADAVKRQLSQMHSQHQRTEYNKKSQAVKQTAEYSKLLDTSVTTILDHDSVADRKLFEIAKSNAVITHLNMVDDKNRRSVNGNVKSEYISNAYSKGMNKKQAEAAWFAERSKIMSKIKGIAEEKGGGYLFSVAAYKKEEKAQQKDLKMVAKGEAWTQGVGSKKELTTQKLSHPPLSPIEEAETEELNIASYISDDEFPKHSPSLSLPQSAQVALTQTGGGSKGIPATDQRSPNLAETSPSLGLEQSPQVALTQEDVNADIAIAKGEPEEEVRQEDIPVPRPIKNYTLNVETPIDLATKAIEGIEPHRTSYGLVAYKTEDEAQRMVNKIREGIVGDETGAWEFAITKVGKVYQVQTQGGATMKDEQKAAFFNKLASEYPGQMGNLEGKWPKDKDYVQIIKGK